MSSESTISKYIANDNEKIANTIILYFAAATAPTEPAHSINVSEAPTPNTMNIQISVVKKFIDFR